MLAFKQIFLTHLCQVRCFENSQTVADIINVDSFSCCEHSDTFVILDKKGCDFSDRILNLKLGVLQLGETNWLQPLLSFRIVEVSSLLISILCHLCPLEWLLLTSNGSRLLVSIIEYVVF